MSIALFTALMVPIAVVGAVIEAAVTALILVYIKRVKPTLIPG